MSDLGTVFFFGTKEVSSERKCRAIEVDAKGDAVINNRFVLSKLLEVKDGVVECVLLVEHAGKLVLEKQNLLRSRLGLHVEVVDDSKRIRRSTQSPEEVRILFKVGVGDGTIGENDISSNNSIQHHTPFAARVPIASMGRMSADANTEAGAMGKSSLALVVETFGNMTKAGAATDLDNVGALVKLDGIHLVQVNHDAAVFASRAERGIRVASALRLDLDTSLSGTDEGIRDVLLRGGKNDCDWLVWKAKIEWFRQILVVDRTGQTDWHIADLETLACSGA